MHKQVEIIDYTYEGHGIAKVDGFPLFIPGTALGDIVDVEITLDKKRYAFAEVVHVHQTTTIAPVCKHYSACGGCQLMHLSDEEQLRMKRMHVQSTLARIAGITLDVRIEPSPAMLRYRNKIRFHVRHNRVGFHQTKSHQIVAIDDCLVSHELASRLAHAAPVDELTRSITIRVNANEEVLLHIDAVKNIKSVVKWAHTEPSIKSLYVGNKHVYGSTGIVESILGIECMMGSESFFQVHTAQAERMFATALSWVDLTNKTVIDAYAGVGIIGMIAAKQAKEVMGIESVTAAMDEANNNIFHNKIHNMTMVQGLVEEVLPTLPSVDLVILDPPRSGMDSLALEHLVQRAPSQILYVSCDPGTLARDLKVLKETYDVTNIQSFDMFSQTYHVETALLLSLKTD